MRGKTKIPVSFHVIFLCWLEHLAPVKKKKIVQQSFSFSLVRHPPVSRPPHHRFGPGEAFLPLCHSEPRRPFRVKPGAHRGRRSPARQCWCSDCVTLSVNFSLVAKISTAWFYFAYNMMFVKPRSKPVKKNKISSNIADRILYDITSHDLYDNGQQNEYFEIEEQDTTW